MYEALKMLDQASNPSIENYAQNIVSFYEASAGPKPGVTAIGERLIVKFDGITFSIKKNCSAYVLKESEGLSRMAKPEEQVALSKSECRFELKSTADSDMLYFNDFLFLIQTAEKFGKVWTFDPFTGKFL